MSAVEGVVLTDGTPAGSRILPVLTGTSVAAQAGGPLFLGGRTDGLGSELWILNDVAGTPELVLDISPGPASSSPGPMAARPSLLGPRAIFFADRADTGRELWTSDGTPEGTELVLDIRPGAEGSDPPTGPQNPHLERKMVFLGSTAFFSADDGVHGAEPWVSDGTPGGTGRLLDLAPGPAASLPQGFTVAGGRVFFTATTPAHGRELWQSDGTGPGTTRVTDLNPGPASSIPMWFTEWNGTLFFSAYDPTVGTELRALDLETGGVTLVHDINPGIGSSSPGGLVQEGGLLWFGATDGVHGFEPWVYELGGVFVDGFESGDLEAWSDSTP